MSALLCRALSAVALSFFATTALAVDYGRTQGAFGVSGGSAAYTVPIWTPPGPNGVQPSLSLNYNSQSGNGLGGVGWNLSGFGFIGRCERTLHQDGGAQEITLTTADRYCINGRRMRLISGSYGAADSVYYTEIADYSRITAFGSTTSGPQYFVVEAKSGMKYQYGFTTDSRVMLGSVVVKWMLNKVYDRNGNNYILSYGNNGANTVRPSSIYWTPTSLNATTYRYEARINYDADRVDMDSTFGVVGGYVMVDRGRIGNIQIRSNGAVIRKYKITYATSGVTSRSLIQSVKECADDAEANCLLPITFAYQPGVAGLTVGASSAPTGSSNSAYPGRYDFNGDGKDDVAYRSGTTWWVAFGANNGFTGPFNTGVAPTSISIGRFLPTGRPAIATVLSGSLWTYRWDDATSAFTGYNTGVATTSAGTPIDFNGDGLDDLIYKFTSSNVIGVRANTSAGSGNPSFDSAVTNSAGLPGQWKYSALFTYGGVGLYRADVNGDGREDLSVRVTWVGDNEPPEGPVSSMVLLGSNLGFTVPSTTTWIAGGGGTWPYINFNGDSCSDRVNGSTIQIAACTGSFATSVTAPAVPLQLLDWDGDGKTDILANAGGTLSVYRSTGNGFSSAISTTIPSAGTFFDADFDGDGLDDLAQINGTSALGYWTHTAGGLAPTFSTNVPDLLSSVTDGFGVAHSIDYTSGARSNYEKGDTTAYPLQEFVPRLVVARAQSSDGIGGAITRATTTWVRECTRGGERLRVFREWTSSTPGMESHLARLSSKSSQSREWCARRQRISRLATTRFRASTT